MTIVHIYSHKSHNLGGTMQATASGLIITSGSSTLTFTQSKNDLLETFQLPPCRLDDMLPDSYYMQLTKGAILPFFYCRITNITSNEKQTFIDTTSSYGLVTITVFGLLDNHISVGETAICFNLVQNFYSGKNGLKFATRSAMFETDGVRFTLNSPTKFPQILLQNTHTDTHCLTHIMCLFPAVQGLRQEPPGSSRGCNR